MQRERSAGDSSPAGAEGATAPETLRQKNRCLKVFDALESGA